MAIDGHRIKLQSTTEYTNMDEIERVVMDETGDERVRAPFPPRNPEPLRGPFWFDTSEPGCWINKDGSGQWVKANIAPDAPVLKLLAAMSREKWAEPGVLEELPSQRSA
jgi:hypothetical protein